MVSNKQVGVGYAGGSTQVPLDESRQTLIREVEANKFNRAKLAQLMGSDERAATFIKRKAGGAYTPEAVIKTMEWDSAS
jgi:hypothetical protein